MPSDKAAVLLAVTLIVTGCDPCPPSFKQGEVVRHKLFGWKGIVIKDAASIENVDGYCLVDVVNDRNGRAGSYATVNWRWLSHDQHTRNHCDRAERRRHANERASG